jgi:hypothetical protein
VTTYLVTLRDRETQTVVGYYDGAWTTDLRRALTLRRREAAEAHAARMRDCCPRNADFNRHIALVDWAAGRNLQRTYCIDFGSAAIASSSALSAVCVCGFDGALSIKRPTRISQRRTHLATRARRRQGQARLTRSGGAT